MQNSNGYFYTKLFSHKNSTPKFLNFDYLKHLELFYLIKKLKNL